MPTLPSSTTNTVPVATRAAAIAEGALVDARAAPFEETTARFFRVPVAMTPAVHRVLQRAVENPRYKHDFPELWQAVCSVWRSTITRQSEDSRSELRFRVRITGAARASHWTFKSWIGADDLGKPCLTILLPHET